MKEIWKDISGYNNKYQISNLGRVKSLNRGGSKILTPRKCSGGYYQVVLYAGGKTSQPFIHRLVAAAFLFNRKNKKEVNHLNGVKEENHLDNLEWCTPSENVRHAYDNGFYSTKLTRNKVHEIRMLYKMGGDYKNLAKMYDVDISMISMIINNKRWNYGIS